MICKICFAEVDDELDVCPGCGYRFHAEETPGEETPGGAEEKEIQSGETPEAEGEPQSEEACVLQEEAPVESQPPATKKTWKLVAGVTAAVIGLVFLAVVLLMAMGVEIKWPTNDIYRKSCYTVSDDKAVEKADQVVARIGDAELTNTQLEIYYRMQVLDFINYYGSYLSYVGLDYTQPLSEQTSYFDETMTWEQYFVDVAIKTWQNYQSMGLQAAEEGFVLDETWEAELAAIPETLLEDATDGGFANVDAYLQDRLGPSCTVDDYMVYVRLNALCNEYYAAEYEKIQLTQEEIEAYFTQHEAEFNQNGITKDTLASSVRHILVCPQGGTVSEDGSTTTYSEEEWAACLTKAEGILQEWKDGEATEESFAAMVAVYSEDSSSVSTGGLYENITPSSSYVENFLNWTVDPTRQTGDTGIVQTQYGYHIMYYVSSEEQWIGEATTQLMAERADAIVEAAKEKNPMRAFYNRIFLAELDLT